MHFIKKTTLAVGLVAAFLLGGVGVSAATVSYHTVQKGDTCYSIAKNYGVELSAVLNANGILSGEILYPGRRLAIDADAKNTVGGDYTVKSGDSLYRIAAAYGSTVSTLKARNGLVSDRIYAGQCLLVGNASASSGLSGTELYLLAKMIHAEARGESHLGRVAVGAVILNRVQSSAFPNTLEGVLYQRNQFTAIHDGQFAALEPDAPAYAAAYEAAGGKDPTYGALFYWNPQKASNAWLNAKTILVTIGNHVFAK